VFPPIVVLSELFVGDTFALLLTAAQAEGSKSERCVAAGMSQGEGQAEAKSAGNTVSSRELFWGEPKDISKDNLASRFAFRADEDSATSALDSPRELVKNKSSESMLTRLVLEPLWLRKIR